MLYFKITPSTLTPPLFLLIMYNLQSIHNLQYGTYMKKYPEVITQVILLPQEAHNYST